MIIISGVKDQRCADCDKAAIWVSAGESGLVYTACSDHLQEIKRFAEQTEWKMKAKSLR